MGTCDELVCAAMRTAPLLVMSLTAFLYPGRANAEQSVHARDAELRPVPMHLAARVLPPPGNVLGQKAWVYGYLPTWIGAPEKIAWDKLSHVAIFKVGLATDGSLTGVSHWKKLAPTAMALGSPYGVRVHLSIACFEKSVMSAVLPQPARRQKTIEALGDLVDAQGAHGVSVDFEFMPVALRDDFTAFIEELKQRVGEVTVATPAVDWARAYDYGKLSEAADALFIMGYDYHWSTGNPGPVAPLKGGGTWKIHALDWTVADYLAAGAPKEKLVLGLPLYGYRWPTANSAVPGAATGAAKAVLMANAMAEKSVYPGLFDDETQTPYYFPDATKQVFYDDTASLKTKIDWALGQGIEGIGFWALGYDGGDPAFWSMVGDATQVASDGGGGGGGRESSPGSGSGRGGGGPRDPSGGEGSSGTTVDGSGGASAAPSEEENASPTGCACATGPSAPTAPSSPVPYLGAVLLALVARGSLHALRPDAGRVHAPARRGHRLQGRV